MEEEKNVCLAGYNGYYPSRSDVPQVSGISRGYEVELNVEVYRLMFFEVFDALIVRFAVPFAVQVELCR